MPSPRSIVLLYVLSQLLWVHLHPIMFRFILWLMPSAMIFLLVIFASTAFRMALYSHVYMASHMAFVHFPLAGLRVSITLSECRSISLHIDFFSFHFVHPGFVLGLPHGLVSSNSHVHIGIVPKGSSFNDFRSKCWCRWQCACHWPLKGPLPTSIGLHIYHVLFHRHQ